MDSWKQLLGFATLPYVWISVIVIAQLSPPVGPIGLLMLIVLALSLFVWTKVRHSHALKQQGGDQALLKATAHRLPATATMMAISTLHASDGDSITTSFATVNCTSETAFEIGSISKAITGLALAAAVEEGRIDLDLPAVEGLPFSFRELATHRSGLPRLPDAPLSHLRIIGLAILQLNPYRGSAERVIRDARRSRLTVPATPRYSNLGGALAGIGLAQHLGETIEESLVHYVLEPIGMKATTPTRSTASGKQATRGYGSSGLPSALWKMDGNLSAGGITSTPNDLAKLAKALLEGTTPGIAAIEPISEMSENRKIGLFWMTSSITIDGKPFVLHWHNGGTGGYSSMLAIVPDLRRGVVVLVNTAGGIDEVALDVLKDRSLWTGSVAIGTVCAH